MPNSQNQRKKSQKTIDFWIYIGYNVITVKGDDKNFQGCDALANTS